MCINTSQCLSMVSSESDSTVDTDGGSDADSINTLQLSGRLTSIFIFSHLQLVTRFVVMLSHENT